MFDINQLIFGFMPFVLLVAVFIPLLRAVFYIVKQIALGNWETGSTDNTINVKVEHKIYIDKDLQKYFNYKE